MNEVYTCTAVATISKNDFGHGSVTQYTAMFYFYVADWQLSRLCGYAA